MSEQQWLGNKGGLDPLNVPLGRWALTGIRPRRDGPPSSYEYVCCGVPVEAIHADSCPQTPFWGQLCAEHGNPLHLFAWGDMTGPFIFAYDPLSTPIYPRWDVIDGSLWTLSTAYESRMRPISDVLKDIDDPTLTFSPIDFEKLLPERVPTPFDRLQKMLEQVLAKINEFIGEEQRRYNERYEIVCAVLDEAEVSLWDERNIPMPFGHIHPEDVGHLAARIAQAMQDSEPRII